MENQETQKKCTHLGYGKLYYEKDNIEGACHYHDGKPMFHDTKKGWTCCNEVAYDWDELQKLLLVKLVNTLMFHKVK